MAYVADYPPMPLGLDDSGAFSFQRAGSGASIALIVALISAVLTAFYVTAMRRQAEVR